MAVRAIDASTWGALRLAAVLAAVAVGCTAAPTAPAPTAPAPTARAHQPSTPPAVARLTKVQACQLLLADVTRHHGRSAVPGLRRVADHVTDPRMAGDARTAVRDLDHTGSADVAFALLRDDCARAGVRIPPP